MVKRWIEGIENRDVEFGGPRKEAEFAEVRRIAQRPSGPKRTG
jgi:hypothetical protein